MRQPTILIVDDSETNLDVLSRRLKRRGFAVLTAVSAHQGIDLAGFRKPDIILMDLSMPDLDGWSATRVLKDKAETRAIPVIAVTAHAYRSDIERALGAGCAEYEVKPINLDRLIKKIVTLLEAPDN